MEDNKRLTPSRQCYLAAILMLESNHGRARQSQLAERIRVNRSSVTAALRALAQSGMVVYEPYGAATLTREGRQIAEAIVNRWRILRDFLMRTLDMEEAPAAKAACQMQNSMPDAVMERISRRLECGSKPLRVETESEGA